MLLLPSTLFDDVLSLLKNRLFFVWCLCMAINNLGVQYNNGRLLPDNILLTRCHYHNIGNPFKCHEEVLSLQPIYDPT